MVLAFSVLLNAFGGRARTIRSLTLMRHFWPGAATLPIWLVATFKSLLGAARHSKSELCDAILKPRLYAYFLNRKLYMSFISQKLQTIKNLAQDT